MRKVFDVIRVAWKANERRTRFYNFVPRRGVRYQENLKWVKPEKKPVYDPARTGDLAGFPALNYDSPYLPFRNSKELENADVKVKKVFSLGYQNQRKALELYERELIDKVKNHPLDDSSEEVKIAKATASIRYFQEIIKQNPTKHGSLIQLVKELSDIRKKKLKFLRLKDYKKFEWLLEKLDLEFRPAVPTTDSKVTRKKSLMLLARFKVEQAKEEKLAALKKALNEQKIPFLEKKVQKLREIKEKEEKYNLPVTVKEEDIQECIEKIEKIKIELAEREEIGYKRKIHPFLLEPYEENLLWKKEKEGELIREKLELDGQKNTGQTNIS